MSEIELKDAYIVGELRRIVATGEGDMLWINRHHAGALLSAINSPMPQWQPIESVPHGKWVYVTVLGASCGGVAMLAEYWISPDMRPDQYAERATHWMPLPAQPEVMA